MTLRATTPPLELWGGVECTCNRVGNSLFDQLDRSGHAGRMEDIERIAALGVTVVRYPVLWERVAPDGLTRASWSWTDARLTKLLELGMTPIAGLLHHGSGPHDTSLVDPAFPARFAEYAAAVAQRYPWLTRYTPINEPLTTARFSALYGHWYPHARSDRDFARAIINQCRATVLAMRAIREVQPDAVLVQTEDLGRVYSTPPLAYQARMENERRWLTFDLLTGSLTPQHAMWDYLVGHGIGEAELHALCEDPYVPAIIGVNHYLTSDRYLDHRLDEYPEPVRGGNGRHQYADVEAVRVLPEGIAGPSGILAEAWDRYRRPLAITEVHVGATREQQLRWLGESWAAAQRARDGGADVRAVTAWSLFGSYDWHSLVTRDEGLYESGVFDVRGSTPRPTALATMVRALATTGHYDHPVLRGRGWWQHDARVLYGLADRSAPLDTVSHPDADIAPPMLIVGATGTLGRAFARVCAARDIVARICSRDEMELTDPQAVNGALDRHQPWAVINAAGYVRVDDAERDHAACFRDNTDGPAILAAACAARGIRLLTFSSDLVFSGARGKPYVESDAVQPLNVYGQSKAMAERAVLERLPSAIVVRTSAFFGPWDEYNFVAGVLRSLDSGTPVAAPDDQFVSPTYVPDLVDTALDLLIDDESGIWHLANADAVSWAELGRRAALLAGLDPTLIQGCAGATLRRPAARPCYSVLGTERGQRLPGLDHALHRYLAARAAFTLATSGAAQ